MAPLPPQHDSDANSHEGVPEVMDEKKTMVHVPSGDWNTETGNTLSDDEGSGHMMDRDYTGMFEGPEKNLEVVFRKIDDAHIDSSVGELCGTETAGPIQRIGLRRLDRDDLDLICARARCTILSSISNEYLDAYVLSESSLFVYPYMLVLKTCGTTTLLRCIATLIDLGRKLGLEIDWVGYSRKNFNFPGDQAFPHQSFHQELDYLYGHRNLSERLDGNGYTLGPVNGDHWFVFVADHTLRSKSLEIDTDRVLNIMMFDIDESVSKLFYYEEYERNVEGEDKDEEVRRISREQTAASGINALCPGAIIDPRAFEPCGYSMNAALFRSYTTIHITPESGSSYVSFETNQKVASYKSLISNVIRTFRPKRFVMTLMADEGGLKQVKENPMTDCAAGSKIVVPATKPMASIGKSASSASFTSSAAAAVAGVGVGITKPGGGKSLIYKRSSLASIKVEEDSCYMMGNWVLEKSTPAEAAAALRAGKPRGMSVS
jgi:S-adenosylmethionine decarboxylase